MYARFRFSHDAAHITWTCYSDVIAHLSPCEPVIVWAFSGVHPSSVSLSVVHRRLSTVVNRLLYKWSRSHDQDERHTHDSVKPFLWNQQTDFNETKYVALGTLVNHCLIKL